MSDTSSDSDTDRSERSEHEEAPLEDVKTRVEVQRLRSAFSPTMKATTTCLHRYAIDRIRHAEENTAVWPPVMLMVFKHVERLLRELHPEEQARLIDLTNERNYVMLELLLDVPIQLRIVYGDGASLDLNVPGSFSYDDVSFVEAILLLRILIATKLIGKEDLRFKELFEA